jgi:hypothetical protein
MQMGEDTLFLKLELLIPQQLLAAGTSCRHQILTEPIERHYIQFLYWELFKKITRLNLGFELKETSLNLLFTFFEIKLWF